MNTIKSKHYSEVKESLDSNESSILTGDVEFDKFVSKKGGLVLKSVFLLTGTSGAGKTTLAVTLQNKLKNYKTSLYCREVTSSKLRNQVDYIKITHGNDYIVDKNDCSSFDEYLKELDVINPKVVFIDSLQVISREDFKDKSEESAAYYIITSMQKWASDNNAVVFIIGHVTKEDGFRGANTIAQMVDAHLEMIYDKRTNTRTMAWGAKTRLSADPTQKLYYKIEEPNGVSFYANKEKISLEELVMSSIRGYVDNLDKENKNYPLFKKEFRDAIKTILLSDKENVEVVIDAIRAVSELIKKYNLNDDCEEVHEEIDAESKAA